MFGISGTIFSEMLIKTNIQETAFECFVCKMSTILCSSITKGSIVNKKKSTALMLYTYHTFVYELIEIQEIELNTNTWGCATVSWICTQTLHFRSVGLWRLGVIRRLKHERSMASNGTCHWSDACFCPTHRKNSQVHICIHPLLRFYIWVFQILKMTC